MIKNEILSNELLAMTNEMIDTCVQLVQIPSVTPPSDTHKVAAKAVELLKAIPGMDVNTYLKEEPVLNVVGILRSGKPGKRLIFNGHLDTYSVGALDTWNDSPWSGIVKDGYIYGRGSSDMKGGIACFLSAVKVLAHHKDLWNGEIVITLAGDEEAMGPRGTRYLLDTVDEATGDAMICADVGAPNSLRFGQKGLLWITLEAKGKPAHGAHLHKGESAILKITEIIPKLTVALDSIPVNAPSFVTEAILNGSKISESTSGSGETEILQKTTINFGTITGGTSPNLVPEYAKTEADIRIPAGVTITQIKEVIEKVIADYPGVTYSADRSFEANWSDVSDRLFSIVKSNSEEVLGEEVVVTFRVGASDSRLYRLIKNVTTINCGLTPYGLGGPNEHVSIEEMKKLHKFICCLH